MQPPNNPTPDAPQQPVTEPTSPVVAPGNPSTQKKLGYSLAIASIVLFFVALYFGTVLVIFAVVAAYGLLLGIKLRDMALIVLGSIGVLLNLGLYTFFVFSTL